MMRAAFSKERRRPTLCPYVRFARGDFAALGVFAVLVERAGVAFVYDFGFLMPAVLVSAVEIRNLVLSFTDANHPGALPRPLHSAPDLGSRYFAGWGPRG
jgi:hypothetical protein